MLLNLFAFMCVIFLYPGFVFAQTVALDGFEYQILPEPAWVEEVALEGDRVNSDEAVQYVLSDTQLKVFSETEQSYRRMIQIPRRQSGVSTVSKIYVSFNPTFQKLAFHKLVVTRDGVVSDRMARSEIKLLRREEGLESAEVIDGMVTAVALLDDIRVDDRIEYQYSILGANPVFDNNHSSFWDIGWGVSIDQLSLRLLIPKQRVIQYQFSDEGLVFSKKAFGKWMEYKAQLLVTEPVFNEEQYPAWYSPLPWVEVTEYASWAAVNEWARVLYEPPTMTEDEAVKTVVQSLISDAMNSSEKIITLLRYVQDEIRYLGIELGENSHRPSNPVEVLARRYGDCKDKTVLLVAMLKQIGVEAYPALASTRFGKVLDNFLPSHSAFNHVIVMFEWQGKRRWVDPTISYQRGDLAHLSNVNYGKSLVVREGEGQLTDMGLDSTHFSKIEAKEQYYVADFKSPVELEVVTIHSGRNADYQRLQFAHYSRRELTRQFQGYYDQLYPGLQGIEDIEYDDNEKNNIVTIREHYLIHDYWLLENEQAKFNLYSSFMQDYVQSPKTIKRNGPLYVSHPSRVSHEMVLRFPEPIQFEISEAEEVVNNDVIRYSRQVYYHNRELHLRHDYVSKQDYVAAADVVAHAKDLSKIRSNLAYGGWVTPQSEPVTTAMSGLIEFLNKDR